MPFVVDQLIYTNLPNKGFQLLSSSGVPLNIKDLFIQEIVQELWNAYRPPITNERQIFLRQFSLNKTLFGWLFTDNTDELGRIGIPYFCGYYLFCHLTLGYLEEVVNILERGPLFFVKTEELQPKSLTRIFLPLANNYNPARAGIPISSPKLAELAACVNSQILLNFQQITHEPEPSVANADAPESTSKERTSLPPAKSGLTHDTPNGEIAQSQWSLPLAELENNTLDLDKISQLLNKTLEVQPAILVFLLMSPEGQPLMPLVGEKERLSPNLSATELLKTVQTCLTLINQSKSNFDYIDFQHLEIHAEHGHLVFSVCFPNCYLLTLTETMLTGVLEVEINRLIKNLTAISRNQAPPEEFSLKPLSASKSNHHSQKNTTNFAIPQPTRLKRERLLSAETKAKRIVRDSSQVLYRGRKVEP